MDMLLSSAVDGWLLTCSARSFSPNTIEGYSRTLKKFQKFLQSDPPIRQITTRDIEHFLIAQVASNKSKLDYYVSLASLWTWALNEGLVNRHEVRALRPPKPDTVQPDPFSEEEIHRLVNATIGSTLYKLKMRATILLLLDTGLRASELCSLRIKDLHLREGYTIVMGKGSKERRVEFSNRTSLAILKYLSKRGSPQDREYFLTSRTGRQLDRSDLAKRIRNLGIIAGVKDVHPHRFRHTFAILFLRNGGTSLALQRLMGHTTMDMVRRYVKLSEVDLKEAHRLASPVENLRL